MVKSSITVKRFAKILFQVISFSAVFAILTMMVGAPYFDVTMRSAIKACLGIVGGYWFINAYIGLMMLVPFLNAMIRGLNRKQHLIGIIVLIAMTSLFPTYMHIPTYVGWLGVFIALYLTAAYFQLYGVPDFKRRGIMCALLFVLSGTIVGIYMANVFCTGFKPLMYSLLIDRQSLPVIMISVLLFAIFVKTSIRNSRIINYAAASTLGVYLFHEHPLMRDFIWQTCLHTKEAASGAFPMLHCVGSIACVYVAGTLVDVVWRHTLGHLYRPSEQYVILPIYTPLKQMANRFLQKVIG